jgi:predicted Zn-dependent protease
MNKQFLTIAMAFFALGATPVYAQKTQSDDVDRAMHDEMQRSMKDLHLESVGGPYYIAYKIVDADRTQAHASFGDLISSSESRNRVLSVTVRVGSYELDNSNFNSGIGGIIEMLGELGSGSNVLPLDDNYDELRRKLWLATDAAYKKAVEDLSAKKAAEQNRNRSETVPSFSKQPARQESETLPPIDAKLPDAEHLVRAASAVFRSLPLVQTSEAEFEVENSTEHFLNSEGTTYIRQVPEVYFHASASIQNPSGEVFRDEYTACGRSLSDLPGEAALVASTSHISDRLTARSRGRAAKRYDGPVLLEGNAAAEVFAHNFADHFAARRSGSSAGAILAMISGNPSAGNASGSSLLNKIGMRVLPEFLSVTDNPQLTQAEGKPLFGNYKFDEEGVPSQQTVLISNGSLKTLLTSRAPARGMHASTGNMREHGVLPGNLFVDASTSVSRDDLRKQLIDLITRQNLEYGLIIQRLSGPIALEAIRVYQDGHEQPVRDARISEITLNSFKDIVAVSKNRTVYTEVRPATAGGDLISYIVPDMLFEEVTVEHAPNETPKPPLVPSPLASE